jgi:hypothetical protein
MLRSLIGGAAVAVMASSGALAQSCTGNPVAVQVLGSGAPGFVKDRANTSYLLWVGNQAASARPRRSFPIFPRSS